MGLKQSSNLPRSGPHPQDHLSKLPVEILQEILLYVSRRDLKAARLACKALEYTATAPLFHKFSILQNYASTLAFVHMCKTPGLPQLVKHLVFDFSELLTWSAAEIDSGIKVLARQLHFSRFSTHVASLGTIERIDFTVSDIRAQNRLRLMSRLITSEDLGQTPIRDQIERSAAQISQQHLECWYRFAAIWCTLSDYRHAPSEINFASDLGFLGRYYSRRQKNHNKESCKALEKASLQLYKHCQSISFAYNRDPLSDFGDMRLQSAKPMLESGFLPFSSASLRTLSLSQLSDMDYDETSRRVFKPFFGDYKGQGPMWPCLQTIELSAMPLRSDDIIRFITLHESSLQYVRLVRLGPNHMECVYPSLRALHREGCWPWVELLAKVRGRLDADLVRRIRFDIEDVEAGSGLSRREEHSLKNYRPGWIYNLSDEVLRPFLEGCVDSPNPFIKQAREHHRNALIKHFSKIARSEHGSWIVENMCDEDGDWLMTDCDISFPGWEFSFACLGSESDRDTDYFTTLKEDFPMLFVQVQAWQDLYWSKEDDIKCFTSQLDRHLRLWDEWRRERVAGGGLLDHVPRQFRTMLFVAGEVAERG